MELEFAGLALFLATQESVSLFLSPFLSSFLSLQNWGFISKQPTQDKSNLEFLIILGFCIGIKSTPNSAQYSQVDFELSVLLRHPSKAVQKIRFVKGKNHDREPCQLFSPSFQRVTRSNDTDKSLCYSWSLFHEAPFWRGKAFPVR